LSRLAGIDWFLRGKIRSCISTQPLSAAKTSRPFLIDLFPEARPREIDQVVPAAADLARLLQL